MSNAGQPDLQATLAGYKELIDADIMKYAAHATQAAGSQYGAEAAETTAAFMSLVMGGGKRLRGALAMVGYEMLGGTDQQMIVRAATAMEMIHAYMLVLDDIQDRSVLRRGKPTLHVTLTGSALAHGDPHVGMSLALNASLAGGHAAQMLLAGLNVDAELTRKVLGIVNLTMVITNHGQNYDLTIEHTDDFLPSDQELENLLQWKTAEYTFLNPLCVGMVLAGAPCEDTNAIRDYALHAGKAFQLANDIDGIFGSEASNGKDIREDIREGKRTFLTVYALRHAGEPDRQFLGSSLGDKTLTKGAFERCKQILRTSGALHYAEQVRDKHVIAAIAALDTVERPWTTKHRHFLRTLVSGITSVSTIDK